MAGNYGNSGDVWHHRRRHRRRRARRSVLVFARHRVTDTGVFVEEKEGDESEREDADAIDAVERRVDGGDEE